MVAVNAVVTVLGALYVTELVVWALSEPAPVSAHATPPFFESFDTVAVMLALCAWSIAELLDVVATLTGREELAALQPIKKKESVMRRHRPATRAAYFMTLVTS